MRVTPMHTAPTPTDTKPLAGWRVLVPRGGPWGDRVAALLRARGATPVVAPLIDFAPPRDIAELGAALADLESGAFDWLTVTSATTVGVLQGHGTRIPRETRIAAVGEATATALRNAGYEVDLVPDHENSAAGMAEQMIALEPEVRRVLVLRSEIAKPLLAKRLTAAGHDVHSVIAYRTVGVPVTEKVQRDVRNGRINAVLVTSGSIAREVRGQFPEMPEATLVAAIGPRTAKDARKAGLEVDIVSRSRTVDALIEAVQGISLPHATDELAP